MTKVRIATLLIGMAAVWLIPAHAQLTDKTKATNVANEGINKSLADEIGAGRGDWFTPNSSDFIIHRDPFRAIRRGRQLFQRKFARTEGHGPNAGDGVGDVGTNKAIGAGLADSCAACHGRPRGSAGVGGDVVTRPDSRDAPHLFGLGLKEMLADEITSALRATRDQGIAQARAGGSAVTMPLSAKGIRYGSITARPDGSLDTSAVQGVDRDLRVRPFFHDGGTISIREFVVGALNAEMGMQSVDPELMAASKGGRMVTLSGMVLDGKLDTIEAPPADDPTADPDGDGVMNEVPAALVDYLEFYLLNYFKAGTGEQNANTLNGRKIFDAIGCATCHIADLQIDHDRRVADVETVYDTGRGVFNNLFATATPLFEQSVDRADMPMLKQPKNQSFLVRNIFTDFKRHDLGPNFAERYFDGGMTTQMMTTALWGVGTSTPYGHDGRSINLTEVILRHGGEAQSQRDNFANLPLSDRRDVLDFLNSLVLFPPDDTASNLDPGNKTTAYYPQYGHGSIRLTVLFNDPADIE